jgi:glycosyltransferase involved in cell wall biosynthesis
VSQSHPRLSIVIPAYNEEARLGRALEILTASEWVRRNEGEIMVVDDGSTDATAAIAQMYANCHPSIRLLRNQINFGKGHSVRRGFLEAHGDVVVFTDVDMSAPITEAEKLLRELRRGTDIALGSRAVDRANTLVKRGKFRALLAYIFRALSLAILGLPFKDTQCGLKAFRRVRTRLLFEQQRIERYAFDTELLFLAKKRGLRVVEIGVNWQHDPHSKICFLSDGSRMLFDLLRVRWWWLTGAYENKP